MSGLKRTARLAGILYFATCLPAPFALIYIPRTLIVREDAAETARRVLASEAMLRLGIACELATAIGFLFVVLTLRRLFRGVDSEQSALMVTLFAISIPISSLNVLNEAAALMLLHGAQTLSAWTKPQLEAMALLFLRLHGYGLNIAAIFWGLWLVPFGLLVYRSGFLPRFLGVLLVINGFAYVIQSFTTVLLPQYRNTVDLFTNPFLVGELAIALWLVIRGVREPPVATVSA
jgi:hypothetical protein